MVTKSKNQVANQRFSVKFHEYRKKFRLEKVSEKHAVLPPEILKKRLWKKFPRIYFMSFPEFFNKG
jgi:hypothetical protein